MSTRRTQILPIKVRLRQMSLEVSVLTLRCPIEHTTANVKCFLLENRTKDNFLKFFNLFIIIKFSFLLFCLFTVKIGKFSFSFLPFFLCPI